MSTPSPINVGSLAAFAHKFCCDVATIPGNVVLLGWSAEDDRWSVAPERACRDAAFADRVPATLRFFGDDVLPGLSGRSFWFPLCFYDGWRERNLFSERYTWVPARGIDASDEWRGAPGEVPILSASRRWIACFGAHQGDPSAVLLPDPHYLARGRYARLFGEVRAHSIAWEARTAGAVFCAGDHGEPANYFPPVVPRRPHPRRYLKEVVDAAHLDVDVHLGHGVTQAAQMTRKWVLDVDGYARTWDAFAWKMQSGCAVLSAASPWESFFTRLFEPWLHFVPVANDFSDLAERLDWCREHDDECRQIAERAQQRAESVYHPDFVADVVVKRWRALLVGAESAVPSPPPHEDRLPGI